MRLYWIIWKYLFIANISSLQKVNNHTIDHYEKDFAEYLRK